MKKMGKVMAVFTTAMLLMVGVALTSCSDDSDDGEETPSYSGKIIRNTVVSLNDSGDVYYEYLSFNGSTGGTYALYKKGESENVKVTTYTNLDGKSVSVPTEFTYDGSTGKFTAGSTSSYLIFNEDDKAIIASEILSGTETSLYSSWKSADKKTFTFTEEGSITVTDGTNTRTSTFTEEDNGLITVSAWTNVSFYWSSAKKLYFPAYETEREEVSEVGRSLVVGEGAPDIAIVSSKFLLIDAAL